MRIKINDKIYRLREIESGVDSLMELVEEPKYKDGDFLHSDWESENITIICKKINGNHLYYHAGKSNSTGLGFNKYGYWPDNGDFRLATESEKKELIDAIEKVGKRWNDEKMCIEDIPKRKFQNGDKVRIKDGISSKTHCRIRPTFVEEMDDLIGKTMTIESYCGQDIVLCEKLRWAFNEEWLEPYVEELKDGDLAIFWDEEEKYATIGLYDRSNGNEEYRRHQDIQGFDWVNAIKFESKEQFKRFIKGES